MTLCGRVSKQVRLREAARKGLIYEVLRAAYYLGGGGVEAA